MLLPMNQGRVNHSIGTHPIEPDRALCAGLRPRTRPTAGLPVVENGLPLLGRPTVDQTARSGDLRRALFIRAAPRWPLTRRQGDQGGQLWEVPILVALQRGLLEQTLHGQADRSTKRRPRESPVSRRSTPGRHPLPETEFRIHLEVPGWNCYVFSQYTSFRNTQGKSHVGRVVLSIDGDGDGAVHVEATHSNGAQSPAHAG